MSLFTSINEIVKVDDEQLRKAEIYHVLEVEHFPQRRGVRGGDISPDFPNSAAPAALRETSSQTTCFNTNDEVFQNASRHIQHPVITSL